MSGADSAAVDQPSKTYNCSCHCGTIKFATKLSPPIEEQAVVSCNCSICAKKGLLLVFVPPPDVSFECGQNEAKGYLFGKKRLEHFSCPNCGVAVYATSQDPNQPVMAINVRTFDDDIDFDNLKLKKYDGKSL